MSPTATAPAPSPRPAVDATSFVPWGAISGISLGGGALLALLIGLAVGGGAEAALVADPGEVVRYGLPIAKLVYNLSASLALGSLLIALFALAPGSADFHRSLDIAAGGAALWTAAAAANALLVFLSVYLEPFSLDERFGRLLGTYLTETEFGASWLIATLMAATVTVLCFAVRSPAILAAVFILGIAALWPVATTGHAGGTADHDAAVTAVFVHSVFAALWVGGLFAIVLLRGTIGDRLPVVLARYSTVALVSFVVVAASGIVSAQLRIGGIEQLASAYGALVMGKVLALTALGFFGAAWRKRLIARVGQQRRPRRAFWIIVAVELAVMGAASGIAAALARTATPVPQIPAEQLANPSPAELLTGAPVPPPIEALSYLTYWQLDLLWALVAAFAAFFYLAGVGRLRVRGDAWPMHRPVLFVIAMLLLVYITSGGVAVYEQYLFSVHMLAHMVLSMGIPVLIVLSAPVTLGARAITARTDGTRGGREWMLAIVHSRYVGVLGHPIVASIIFAVSLLVFYYTPLFEWAVTDHLGHQWMIIHFLLSGYLFANMLAGEDPAPFRPPYPIRLVILLATMAFHAFFGLSLIMGESLLLVDWYGAMGREWGQDPLADQQTGGGIAWSVGEIPTLALALLVMVAWSRSDKREAKRLDRRADRDGDADLAAWNDMLAERARQG